MASKETPLRAAPLHHAIVKPKGGGGGWGGGGFKQQPSGNLLWARRIKVTVGHGGDTEEKMVTVEKKN